MHCCSLLQAVYEGGAIKLSHAAPGSAILTTRFETNTARQGGAIAVTAHDMGADVSVSGCTFDSNAAKDMVRQHACCCALPAKLVPGLFLQHLHCTLPAFASLSLSQHCNAACLPSHTVMS